MRAFISKPLVWQNLLKTPDRRRANTIPTSIPICLRRSSTLTSRIRPSPDWSDSKKAELIKLINTSYRDKIAGDWDLVIRHIEDIPAKHQQIWTENESKRLGEYIHTNYVSKRIAIDWEQVARALGRSAQTCLTVYYTRASSSWNSDRRKQVEASDREALARIRPLMSRHSQAADRHGVVAVDWEHIAKEMEMPFADLLATVLRSGGDAPELQPEHLPPLKYPQDWSPEHLQRLKQFTLLQTGSANEPPAWHAGSDTLVDSKVDTRQASLYMGVHLADCAEALEGYVRAGSGLKTKHREWSDSELERLKEACAQPKKYPHWKQVAAYVGGGRSSMSCTSMWQRLENQKYEGLAKWTPEENARLEEYLLRCTPKRSHLNDLCKMFPDKERVQVRAQLSRIKVRVRMRTGYQLATQNSDKLQRLVAEATSSDNIVDWNAVAKEMKVTPRICKRVYGNLTRKHNCRATWSDEEQARFAQALREGLDKPGFSWNKISRIMSTRSVEQCISRHTYLKKLNPKYYLDD
ncbi:hypothetical protein GGI07_005858 [Coemansia sp. Benny D115]|nr:hypothetical protein GGI07_005858 [Coemansia sp. Benny D115]